MVFIQQRNLSKMSNQMKNELAVIIGSTGIERDKAEGIWLQFESFFRDVSDCAEKVSGLEITDVSQKEEMSLARKTRIELKNIRVAAEKTKKQLKENILKEGKFIDSTYNLIANTTKPIETDLLEKEQFAKRKEEERIRRIVSERESSLLLLGVDVRFLDIAKMSDGEFSALLEKSTREHEERLYAERKAEEERLAREKAEAEERSRIEAENARLRAEAEERERQLLEERAKLEAERRARDEAERRERDARELAERAEREKHAAEIRKANDAAAKAQRELREKQEAEDRARKEEAERAEAQRRADEEERRRMAAAGDKEKLSVYFDKILSIEKPIVNSDKADILLSQFIDCIDSCISSIKNI
jgi:hypothetical protein